MSEILMAAMVLFIFKQGSRNAINNKRQIKRFAKNYFKLFGLRLPHMDTVNDVLTALEPIHLENLKTSLIATLIEKKIWAKSKLLGKYYRVAVDATGVISVLEGHCDHCLHKTSKNDVTTYFHNVLEAKLIAPNGFCISLATEWIENHAEYNKQDCELKAFARLAEKLKAAFPRLPIVIHADGLYPNNTAFDICKKHGWHFIFTLQDDSLKSLWEEIDMELLISKNQMHRKNQKTLESYRWLNDLPYHDRRLNWFELTEDRPDSNGGRFVHVTDLPVDAANVCELSESGRMRFKIENEGFNTQKNQGYAMQHKYSRNSNNAMKNYYAMLQIAHLFNQLYVHSPMLQMMLIGKMTLKHLWEFMIGYLMHRLLPSIDATFRFQIRYD